MVVSSSGRTTIRLIKPEHSEATLQRLLPVGDDVPYVSVCRVHESLDDAWRMLQRGKCTRLQSDKSNNTIYVVTDAEGAKATDLANRIATKIFQIPNPRIDHVKPRTGSTASSLAGLASYAPSARR